MSGNEGISYGIPSPNYSTSSSTADEFLRNIEKTQKEFDADDREFENVMSNWSDKTGNKIGVWIKVNVSDEYDLIMLVIFFLLIFVRIKVIFVIEN